jgi:hypothetical protein
LPQTIRIAFTSNRLGQRDIYQTPADGSGSAELLFADKIEQKNLEDWSQDGKYLVYNYQIPHQPTAYLYVLPLLGDRKPVPFLKMQYATQQGQLSPNGRWIAYRSTESGRPEIYVQGFTLDSSQPHGKWQISTAGGELPRWRRDGKELFYHYNNTFYAVDVKADGASFEVGIPRPLFDAATVPSGGTSASAPFVVTKDGQRFLILTPSEKRATEQLGLGQLAIADWMRSGRFSATRKYSNWTRSRRFGQVVGCQLAMTGQCTHREHVSWLRLEEY